MIREAIEADWPSIYPFFSEIVAAGHTYAYPENLTLEDARSLWMAPSPSRTVVAVDGDAVVGSATMSPNRPGRGSHVATGSFMVDPRHHGPGRRPGAREIRAGPGPLGGLPQHSVQRSRREQWRRNPPVAVAGLPHPVPIVCYYLRTSTTTSPSAVRTPAATGKIGLTKATGRRPLCAGAAARRRRADLGGCHAAPGGRLLQHRSGPARHADHHAGHGRGRYGRCRRALTRSACRRPRYRQISRGNGPCLTQACCAAARGVEASLLQACLLRLAAVPANG